MNKKPIYAGYINLRPINGIIFPSYAQNQIYKDYIVNHSHDDKYIFSVFDTLHIHESENLLIADSV